MARSVPLTRAASLVRRGSAFFVRRLDDMSDKPQRPSRRRKIFVWIIRGMYISVLMASIDCYSGWFYGHGVFSMTLAGMRDGGTTMSVGPGYCMTFWRRMDGDAVGPEIWFWFTPFIVDAAHRGVQIHWIWSR